HVGLEKEPVLVEGDLQKGGEGLRVRGGAHADGEHGEIELPLEYLTQERVLAPEEQALRSGDDLRDIPPREEHALLLGLLEKLLPAPRMGADIHIERLDVGVLVPLLDRLTHAQGIDAADPRAVRPPYLFVPRPHAVEDGDPGLLGERQAVRPSLEVDGGHDPRVSAVIELALYAGVKGGEAYGHDHPAGHDPSLASGGGEGGLVVAE